MTRNFNCIKAYDLAIVWLDGTVTRERYSVEDSANALNKARRSMQEYVKLDDFSDVSITKIFYSMNEPIPIKVLKRIGKGERS